MPRKWKKAFGVPQASGAKRSRLGRGRGRKCHGTAVDPSYRLEFQPFGFGQQPPDDSTKRKRSGQKK